VIGGLIGKLRWWLSSPPLPESLKEAIRRSLGREPDRPEDLHEVRELDLSRQPITDDEDE
jgi:hypothetical protein